MKTYKSNTPQYRLVKEPTNIKKVKITKSGDIDEYARQFYHDDIAIYESFFTVFLNSANNTIGWVKISQGGLMGTVVDERLITKYAIESLCVAVILCHNHPSGRMKPSDQDIRITNNIKKALNYFSIRLLDHIILSSENYKYYSFADEGLIH
jgi:DNA repair protein RadC